MTEPFIRPYNPAADFEACLHIFRTTIDPSLAFEPASTIGSYIWCRPYIHLSPHTCYVLDNGSGQAVGYIIGTETTATFSKRWKSEFVPTVELKNVPKPGLDRAQVDLQWMREAVYNGECSTLLPFPELLEEYPAHLHIDILPAFTGKGWGGKMVGVFEDRMRELGAEGVHLGMVRTNERAKAFYERLGFEVCGQVLDGGTSGEVGREGDAVCLVKTL
ncbi:acyl-CoA N-acyltransferase [Lophiotrema nucula]|uniref:Acyl-CoA N-acyltransferase n=1 Tax=Lophiotrema nucula TaxID=690887 RepID=A0A6A5YN52_9PLEO|nr:acyl-CoA N-acyltransferase [Lophiotrema nucula]